MNGEAWFTKNQDRRPQTPVEALRRALDRLEAQVTQLRRISPAEAWEILALFDEAAALLQTLEEKRGEPRAEASRFESISATLRRRAREFVRKLGGKESLRAERAARGAEAPGWWWELDHYLAEKQRQWRRRTLGWFAGGVAIVAVLVLLYQRFLAPSPELRAKLMHEQQAVVYIMEDDLEAAYREVNLALEAMPGDEELLTLRGVIAEGLGDEAQAQADFAAAEITFAERKTFLLTRSSMYLQSGRAEAAVADALAVLEEDPESAPAYLQLGIAYEQLGEVQAALASYEAASRWADEVTQAQIIVTARMRMTLLAQQSLPPEGTEQP